MSTTLRAPPKSWSVYEIWNCQCFHVFHPGYFSSFTLAHPVSENLIRSTAMKVWQSARRVSGSTRTCFCLFVLAGFQKWILDVLSQQKSVFLSEAVPKPPCKHFFQIVIFHSIYLYILQLTVSGGLVCQWIPSAGVRWSSFLEMAGCVYQVLKLRAGMKPLQMG